MKLTTEKNPCADRKAHNWPGEITPWDCTKCATPYLGHGEEQGQCYACYLEEYEAS